jgi:hypothetical protein
MQFHFLPLTAGAKHAPANNHLQYKLNQVTNFAYLLSTNTYQTELS